MAEPASTGAVVGVGVTTMAAVFDSYLGKEVAFVVLVIAGAFIGTSGGCIASPRRGAGLAMRGIFGFLAGVFSSFFMLTGFVSLPPALLCAVVAFIFVEPIDNFNALMAMIDRVRGKSVEQKGAEQ